MSSRGKGCTDRLGDAEWSPRRGERARKAAAVVSGEEEVSISLSSQELRLHRLALMRMTASNRERQRG
jgi:hypothetical protein